MTDVLLAMFSWITPLAVKLSQRELQLTSEEQEIVNAFSSGWGKTNTVDLLRGLSEKYGEKAGITVEKALAVFIAEDWAETGAREAHPGTEIVDFIKILWEPLKNAGFEYTSETKGQRVTFNVSKCPVYEAAQRTGLHKWLFHLACATDLTSTCAFSSHIKFERTKTLMEGFNCCDHTYTRIMSEG